MLLALIYGVVLLVAQNSPSNGPYCLVGLLVASSSLVLLALILQTCHPRYRSQLYRIPNDPTNIIAFAFSRGDRAQACLTQHFQRRAELSAVQLSTRRLPLPVFTVSSAQLLCPSQGPE